MALDYEKFKKIITKIKSERPTRIGKGGSTSVFTNNKEFQKIVKEITEAGVPIKEAAKKLGVAHSTISNARKELGLATRADVGGYSYLDDPKNIKYIKKNIGNKKLTTMGKELFPDIPEDISKVRVKLLRKKHLPKSLRTGEFSAEAKAELSPEKAAERARDRARIRTAKLTKNSDVNVERSINKLKKGYGVDLAHLQRKSLPQTTTNIGMDIPASNRGAMEVVEKIISDLENTNKKLYNTYKNKTLPKNVIDKIELNNQKIIDLVYKSNGAVVGNILDDKTGKATEFLGSYKYSADDGLFNLPMKEIAKDPQSLAEFKVVALNKAEQIAKLKGKTVEELFPDLLADPDIKKRTDQILQEKNLVNNLVKKTVNTPGGCQAVVKRALGAKGGLFGETCEAIIRADPERAAVKLNNAITATKGPLKDLKQDSQKLIRLFRGESFPQRNTKAFKDTAKHFGTTVDAIKKDTLSGQWYTPNQTHAASYLDKPGRMKYVDVTPAELAAFNKYKDRVNKTNVKWSERALEGNPFKQDITTSPHHQVIPRYKLKQMEEAGRLKSKLNINPFTKKNFAGALLAGDEKMIPSTAGVLEYNVDLGGFVDSSNPGEVVGQNQLKTWAEDNPMEVKVGTEPPTPNKSVLKTVGKTLAKIGTPLPTALIDGYFINKQMDEGKSTAEIAKDPLNWLGLATMEPLTKVAGANTSGGLNAVLRLGLNPATIRGITRFAGLPGLAISTAMTAYDQYKKYQNEEGFVYNLFNKEGN